MEELDRVCSQPEHRFAETKRVRTPGRLLFLNAGRYRALVESMTVLRIASAEVVEVRVFLHRVRCSHFDVASGARLEALFLLVFRFAVRRRSANQESRHHDPGRNGQLPGAHCSSPSDLKHTPMSQYAEEHYNSCAETLYG